MVTWDDDGDEPLSKQLLVQVAARNATVTTNLEESEHSRVVLVVKWSIVVIPAIMIFTIMKGVIVGMVGGILGLSQ